MDRLFIPPQLTTELANKVSSSLQRNRECRAAFEMTMEISHVAASSTGSIAGPVYDATITGSVVSLDRLPKQYGKAALPGFL